MFFVQFVIVFFRPLLLQFRTFSYRLPAAVRIGARAPSQPSPPNPLFSRRGKDRTRESGGSRGYISVKATENGTTNYLRESIPGLKCVYFCDLVLEWFQFISSCLELLPIFEAVSIRHGVRQGNIVHWPVWVSLWEKSVRWDLKMYFLVSKSISGYSKP